MFNKIEQVELFDTQEYNEYEPDDYTGEPEVLKFVMLRACVEAVRSVLKGDRDAYEMRLLLLGYAEILEELGIATVEQIETWVERPSNVQGVTVDELATRLGRSRTFIYSRINAGVIATVLDPSAAGRRFIIPESEARRVMRRYGAV